MNVAAQYGLVFASTLAADYAWTKYNVNVSAKRATAAASWSAAIVGFGAVSVVSYTHDPKLVIAALLGAFVGTWIAVKREE